MGRCPGDPLECGSSSPETYVLKDLQKPHKTVSLTVYRTLPHQIAVWQGWWTSPSIGTESSRCGQSTFIPTQPQPLSGHLMPVYVVCLWACRKSVLCLCPCPHLWFSALPFIISPTSIFFPSLLFNAVYNFLSHSTAQQSFSVSTDKPKWCFLPRFSIWLNLCFGK